MNGQEALRQAIDQEQDRLRSAIPPARPVAILAVLRVLARLQPAEGEPPPDLVTGRRRPLAELGGNKALQLCLESASPGDAAPVSPAYPGDTSNGWAARFLEACGRLAEAELVLSHVETGFMRVDTDGDGTFHAWVATRRTPPSWQERADLDWWSASLAAGHEPERRDLERERAALAPGDTDTDTASEAVYRRLGDLYLARLAPQWGYPPDAELEGCTVGTYRAVLARLIAWALAAHDRGEAAPRPEGALVAALASDLDVDADVIGRAVAALTFDGENAAHHAAVPGVAAAPLVRLDADRLALSLHGLTAEPLLFLARELRRRAPEAYHNRAHLREDVFRQDLYALFTDKRFVTSAGRVVLRRAAGDARTDIDAVIFDRKTGALALFELKSQDPFARSAAELARQRDNLLYANRQLSGILAWLQHHGGDALLSRVDQRTAKTFRVTNVYPFVFSRYLAPFGDGPAPDRRAAWATWPQLLRLLDTAPIRPTDAKPLATLFTRLRTDTPRTTLPADAPPKEITIGASRLVVRPSFRGTRG